jgi:tRNA (guanosine-2'-O-)-methyltransferase
VYIVDPRRSLPDDWQEMRERKSLAQTSVSASKWSFVKRSDSSESCLNHLETNRFVSIVTSPHIKGKTNVVLQEGDYTIFNKLAIWFGNEKRGISTLPSSAASCASAFPCSAWSKG